MNSAASATIESQLKATLGDILRHPSVSPDSKAKTTALTREALRVLRSGTAMTSRQELLVVGLLGACKGFLNNAELMEGGTPCSEACDHDEQQKMVQVHRFSTIYVDVRSGKMMVGSAEANGGSNEDEADVSNNVSTKSKSKKNKYKGRRSNRRGNRKTRQEELADSADVTDTDGKEVCLSTEEDEVQDEAGECDVDSLADDEPHADSPDDCEADGNKVCLDEEAEEEEEEVRDESAGADDDPEVSLVDSNADSGMGSDYQGRTSSTSSSVDDDLLLSCLSLKGEVGQLMTKKKRPNKRERRRRNNMTQVIPAQTVPSTQQHCSSVVDERLISESSNLDQVGASDFGRADSRFGLTCLSEADYVISEPPFENELTSESSCFDLGSELTKVTDDQDLSLDFLSSLDPLEDNDFDRSAPFNLIQHESHISDVKIDLDQDKIAMLNRSLAFCPMHLLPAVWQRPDVVRKDVLTGYFNSIEFIPKFTHDNVDFIA